MRLTHLLLLGGFGFFSQFAFAAPTSVQCFVSQVLDGGDFENVNDFSFEDYPNIAFEASTPEGQNLIVGAFSFSEKDSYSPAQITIEKLSNGYAIHAQPQDSKEIYTLVVLGDTGFLDFNDNGTKTHVARLACQ